MLERKNIPKEAGCSPLDLLHDNSAYRMQGEKHQKRISAQNSDKTPKRSLCSTLCSWCSTPGTGTHRILFPVSSPSSQRRTGRMYYILKEWRII